MHKKETETTVRFPGTRKLFTCSLRRNQYAWSGKPCIPDNAKIAICRLALVRGLPSSEEFSREGSAESISKRDIIRHFIGRAANSATAAAQSLRTNHHRSWINVEVRTSSNGAAFQSRVYADTGGDAGVLYNVYPHHTSCGKAGSSFNSGHYLEVCPYYERSSCSICSSVS